VDSSSCSVAEVGAQQTRGGFALLVLLALGSLSASRFGSRLKRARS
jgi:MYXO-CTERM domain-containing protein